MLGDVGGMNEILWITLVTIAAIFSKNMLMNSLIENLFQNVKVSAPTVPICLLNFTHAKFCVNASRKKKIIKMGS